MSHMSNFTLLSRSLAAAVAVFVLGPGASLHSQDAHRTQPAAAARIPPTGRPAAATRPMPNRPRRSLTPAWRSGEH